MNNAEIPASICQRITQRIVRSKMQDIIDSKMEIEEEKTQREARVNSRACIDIVHIPLQPRTRNIP